MRRLRGRLFRWRIASCLRHFRKTDSRLCLLFKHSVWPDNAFQCCGSSPIQLLGVHMFSYVATILVAILLSAPLVAGITPFPASFHTQMVATNGTSLYVRVGGKGPTVVLLHGFGDTGDMWAPLAIALAKDHTVIVPDLRGMG